MFLGFGLIFCYLCNFICRKLKNHYFVNISCVKFYSICNNANDKYWTIHNYFYRNVVAQFDLRFFPLRKSRVFSSLHFQGGRMPTVLNENDTSVK